MGLLDKAKQLLGQHDDKVDQAIGKAGEAAKQKYGHDAQIDQGVDQLRRVTGEGDTTQQAPPPPAPPQQ